MNQRPPITDRVTRLLLHACILFLAFLPLHASAFAAEQGLLARELAAKHGMEYQDMSQGVIHACKLVGNGHEVVLSAGVRNILVDGKPVLLARPVQWDGKALRLPAEADALFTRRFGKPDAAVNRAYPLAERYPALQPVRPRKKEPRKLSCTVVIDPGHGGRDKGASRSGLNEKDIVLEIARRVAPLLEARGIKVVWMRRTDVFISLQNRVAIANRRQPDLFLSIHANTEPTNTVRGALTFYPAEGRRGRKADLFGRAKQAVNSRSMPVGKLGVGGAVEKNALVAVAGAAYEGRRLESIRAAEEIQNALNPVTGFTRPANGLRQDRDGFHVLSYVQAPAVLTEVDFLSHSASRKRLATSYYRARLADGIAKGVISYLEKSSEEK